VGGCDKRLERLSGGTERNDRKYCDERGRGEGWRDASKRSFGSWGGHIVRTVRSALRRDTTATSVMPWQRRATTS
jgi:hypothetical protein